MKIDSNNEGFQQTLNLIQFSHQSIFLTGKAGTGKSTFLKHLCKVTKKKHVVLAPTGIAAINAGGVTLHSFFKLPFSPLLQDDPNYSLSRGMIHKTLKYSAAHKKLIKNLELIIIDEISMVRADIIDFIDKVLRIYSQNMREPFGGKQLLLVGDVFQLEPVVSSSARDIIERFYPNVFFFSAHAFRSMQLVSIELLKVYRQTDMTFVNVLNHIRTNTATAQDLQLLNSRYQHRMKEEEMYVTLATRRSSVDRINEEKLAQLSGDSILFNGEIKGDFPESSLPTSLNLDLKVGAQVIFIKNDFERRWVNGTLAVIADMNEEGTITVLTEEGNQYVVTPELWRNVRYQYNEKEKKVEEIELGTFVQLPIRLAWALTIHKSQGLTFTKVKIDLSGGVFAGGQTYVALSRCTSLEGLSLEKMITQRDIFVRREIANFSTTFNDKMLIDKSLKEAKADVHYQKASKAFDAGHFQETLRELFIAMHARNEVEKPLVQRFISRKLSCITTLKEKNKQLLLERELIDRRLEELAREYYEMGIHSISLASDTRSAIANFRKAISLYPNYNEAWIRLGIVYYNEKDSVESQKAFNTSIALDPNQFKSRYYRAKNYMNGNYYEEAITDLKKACDLRPKDAKVHELLGDCFSKLGDFQHADFFWQIAEQLKKEKNEND